MDDQMNRVNRLRAAETIAGAWAGLASEMKALGNAGAMTPMGAIEAHGKAILDTGERLYDGLQCIGHAIETLAKAIDQMREEAGGSSGE